MGNTPEAESHLRELLHDAMRALLQARKRIIELDHEVSQLKEREGTVDMYDSDRSVFLV